MSNRPRIIVLDDDPMGSQTVHSCLLLTQWDVSTLLIGLQDKVDIFFILTNTRGLDPKEAAIRTREVCENLKIAITKTNTINFLLVSRSDSTLRGHYPIEINEIDAVFKEFDAHFLIPAFFEAGRFTRNSIHYLMNEGVPQPVHLSEFAKDSVFAYTHSYLPDYIEEKTKGQVPASTVERLLLSQIRNGSLSSLLNLKNQQCCVVDGENQSDFDFFANDLLAATNLGKRFLLSSAAGILVSLAKLGIQTIQDMSLMVRNDKPGVIIIGSHVGRTTRQLDELLRINDVDGVEMSVERLLTETSEILVAEILEQIKSIRQKNKTPVIYTSREEYQFPDIQARQLFGRKISKTLAMVVCQLPEDISFLISKGGVTSNSILTDGLSLPSVRLLGQIYPGCSVVQTDDNHHRYPLLPVVLFPGNVGDDSTLVTIYRKLTKAL